MARQGKIDGLSESIGQLKAISKEHGKKLDEISSGLKETNTILRDNTSSLQEHMLQTRLTQEQNKILKDEHLAFMGLVDKEMMSIEDRIKPIEEHVQNIHGITKLAKFMLPLIGFPAALFYSLKVFTEYILPWITHK